MIEVRIRMISEATPAHLCTWPATELDRLLPTIQTWGLQGVAGDLSGEFVVYGGEAFFEVIVDDIGADPEDAS